MDDPELTQRDFDAADEVLRRVAAEGGAVAVDEGSPAGYERALADTRREFLAQLHAHLGRSRFRLYYGLRQPRSVYEKWRFQHFHGQITYDELREKMRQRAERPVDQEMIDELFSEVDSIVEDYRQALRAAAATANAQCTRAAQEEGETKATRLLKRTSRTLNLDNCELQTASLFLTEMRIESGLGMVWLGKHAALNAAELVFIATRDVRLSWRDCQENARRRQTDSRRPNRTTAAALLFEKGGPEPPHTQHLMVLVAQERIAATMALRKRSLAAGTSDQQAAENVVINATNVQLDLTTLQNELSRVKSEKPIPLLKVNSWSELAVAIDEDWDYWAVSPAPGIGCAFRMNKAKRLNLRGARWEPLFKLLAASPTRDRAPLHDVARAFGFLSPGATVDIDSRARPGKIREATVSELQSAGSPIRTQVNDALKTLGNSLRKKIEGPVANDGDPCFCLDRDHVRSGFVVSYLIKQDNRSFTFGPRPMQ